MAKNENGGPAFPFDEKNSYDGSHYHSHEGMSLRDWFAGQALAGFVVRQSAAFSDAETGAKFAYRYADAMMAEREKDNA